MGIIHRRRSAGSWSAASAPRSSYMNCKLGLVAHQCVGHSQQQIGDAKAPGREQSCRPRWPRGSLGCPDSRETLSVSRKIRLRARPGVGCLPPRIVAGFLATPRLRSRRTSAEPAQSATTRTDRGEELATDSLRRSHAGLERRSADGDACQLHALVDSPQPSRGRGSPLAAAVRRNMTGRAERNLGGAGH